MLENIPYISYIISAFVGIGLSAAAGFRIFLPMFILSLCSYMGWAPVGEGFEWLSGLTGLISTGVATIFEILSYYIPLIDNFLDTLSVPLATVAGAVIFASQLGDISGVPEWVLAIIAGGGTAATVSAGFAKLRAVSSLTTGGMGNSVVSTTENAGAGIMTFLALFAPVVAVILIIVMFATLFFLIRKFSKTKN